MKALTICQPYASLIARGLKRVENRTWWTSYRGRILIHACKSKDWLGYEPAKPPRPKMAFGAFIATARLADCVHISRLSRLAEFGLLDHSHTHGPWCWVLEDVKALAILGA